MSDPMNDVKAAFVLAAEHANSASAEAASRIFDAALAIHDEEVRADERGKVTIENWPKFQCDSCGYPVYSDGKYWRCVICANDGMEPIAAARGDGAE